METTADILDAYGVDSIVDLNWLETRRIGDTTYERLALPDGENSIWVCADCGELCDPEEDEGAHEEDCCVLIGLD